MLHSSVVLRFKLSIPSDVQLENAIIDTLTLSEKALNGLVLARLDILIWKLRQSSLISTYGELSGSRWLTFGALLAPEHENHSQNRAIESLRRHRCYARGFSQ